MKSRNPVALVVKFGVPVVLAAVAAAWFVTQPPPPAPTPTPAPVIKRVRVIIDSSASMAGYLTGKTEFKDRLAQLIAGLPALVTAEGKTPDISFAFARASDGSFETFKGSPQDLLSQLLDNKLMANGSSMLQAVMNRITDEIVAEDVNVLVTDGIFSYPNEAIARNREINRESIGGLASAVETAFSTKDWAKKKMRPAMAVLQYTSAFNGTYYTYRNDKVPLAGVPRPYYVWIVGDAPRVGVLFSALRKSRDLSPQHAVTLGTLGSEANARVLVYTNREGTWERGVDNVLSLTRVGVPSGQTTVTVALNLPFVPEDSLSRDHVMKQAKVESTFATIVPSGFYSLAQMSGKLDPLDKSDLAGATHFLALDVKALKSDTETATVRLMDELPAWCREINTDNDTLAVPGGRPTTFGFLPILDGAARGLRSAGTGRPLIEFQLTLQR